jgi:hypothetical protein
VNAGYKFFRLVGWYLRTGSPKNFGQDSRRPVKRALIEFYYRTSFFRLSTSQRSVAVGTSIAGCPRTDPGGRDSRTGLPPRVVNDESHEQLRVHIRASGTRLPGAVSGTCVARPCSPRSSPLAPPAPPPVAQVCSPASVLLGRGLTCFMWQSQSKLDAARF